MTTGAELPLGLMLGDDQGDGRQIMNLPLLDAIGCQRLPHFTTLFCFRFVRRSVSRLRVSIVHSTISPFLKSIPRAIAAGKFTYHCSVFFRAINWIVTNH
ncbi:MAG: hypothetical protein NTV93_11055 [Verrucomicrobia bacterium]|nr:hypothetical protein [Verrucomicrobiota bacterium]